VIVFLTTADTEVLACERARAQLPADFEAVRALNPTTHPDAGALVDAVVDAAPTAVLVRLLGGRRAWEGFDALAARCAQAGIALLAFGGEATADADLTAASTAPGGVVADAFEYLVQGGVANTANLLCFVADTLGATGFGFAPPVQLADHGLWHPRHPEPLAAGVHGKPTVAVAFYRTHWMSGNTDFVAALIDAVEAAGANAVGVFAYSLRPNEHGEVPALDLVAGRVDALITTVLATGGSNAGDAWADDERAAGWDVPALARLDVPVVQAIGATSSRAQWAASDWGLKPLDAAMQVAIPEFDGRLITVPVSFKEAGSPRRDEHGGPDQDHQAHDGAAPGAATATAEGGEAPGPPGGGAVATEPGEVAEAGVPAALQQAGGVAGYVADAERCARAAGIAVRQAQLAHTPPERRRLAIVLSNYPTQHSRVGNGVGLDTPASAAALLDHLTAAGYDTGQWPAFRDGDTDTAPGGDTDTAPGGHGDPGDDANVLAPGDRLIHALIDAGGFDADHLSEGQLAANPFAVDAATYAAWFAELPEALRQRIVEHWGQPPGGVLVHDSGDGGGHKLRFAGLELGNVLVAIQPPRGFGENPVAIYHDPDLPPTHHYLAFYRWLDRAWGADAVAHLGKHGTLEWLPGKSLGLSADSAPDQVLGDLPLVYPFVVNDPGEGTQAKRRAHATIVDHLVAPMTRADTYDDLARLEQLLDEYEHVKAMDPAKDAAMRGEIWQLLRACELTRDLGWSDADAQQAPPDLDDRLTEVDGWLCEIKDAQIRGGLHVLGRAPDGDTRRDLVLAILRLPQAGHPGLRAAIAAAVGLDEAALLNAPGEPADHQPPGLLAAAPGPARTAADLIDRLEGAATALVQGMDAKGWDAAAADAVIVDVLGELDAPAHQSLAGVLSFAASEIVPRLDATTGELDAVAGALAGRYTPSGPAGAPTRGRVDVLPTGKNFYSVDPKALPSELSWQVGWSLAQDLIAAHTEQHGGPPAHVALVVWGTAAMRTHGDDVAEALALLGVRPVWTPESRRVTGLELMSLAELGRARVDVTLRISGFFRDAFPHLVALVDDAVALAAEASDEPDELNPVAAAARDDAAALQAEQDLDADTARRRATTRVFGAKPGAYGAGLLPLIDARNWRDDADLAEVYATWGGHAYGRGLNGVEARDDMARAFSRVQVAVKNTDSREHDLLDSDDYFQEHGGMVALVRHLAGAGPQAVIGDSSDPGRVATRDLATEVARVYRSRVANPKWIEAMRAHGYKGAFELAATVDYLFGYDATAGCVADWMYGDLAARYTEDPDTRAFLEQANPWALKAIAERLLEAADRGLWGEPDPDRLERLRATYLDSEATLEDRT